MRKVTVMKYDSKIRGYCFTDIIGVYSSRKKANDAMLRLMLHVEEDLNDKKIGYSSSHESDKARGLIVTDEGSEYLYYCVDCPFDALETVDGIELIR